MKSSSLLPLLLAAAAGFPAYGDLVIVQKFQAMGQAGEMTMKVGPDKIRTDVTPQVSTISDPAAGVVTTLMHTQKTYMVISKQATEAMMAQVKSAMAAGGGSATPPKVTPTGKTEKIDGYDAAEYTFTNGFIKGTYWVSSTYPNAKAITAAMQKFQQGGMAAMARDFSPDLTTLPGVPVKTEMEFNGQKVETDLESATEMTVDPSEYTVPAGYTETKMPSMPGMSAPQAAPQASP